MYLWIWAGLVEGLIKDDRVGPVLTKTFEAMLKEGVEMGTAEKNNNVMTCIVANPHRGPQEGHFGHGARPLADGRSFRVGCVPKIGRAPRWAVGAGPRVGRRPAGALWRH